MSEYSGPYPSINLLNQTKGSKETTKATVYSHHPVSLLSNLLLQDHLLSRPPLTQGTATVPVQSLHPLSLSSSSPFQNHLPSIILFTQRHLSWDTSTVMSDYSKPSLSYNSFNLKTSVLGDDCEVSSSICHQSGLPFQNHLPSKTTSSKTWETKTVSMQSPTPQCHSHMACHFNTISQV